MGTITKVVGLGGGGHARVIIEIIRLVGQHEIVAILDPNPSLAGKSVLGIPVRGNDDLLAALKTQGVAHFFVGVGSVGSASTRQRLYDSAIGKGVLPVSAIHPKSVISRSALIGTGATIMAGAVINAGATLGVNVIINSGAIVEHDCIIGNHVHVASGACLASTVRVCEGAHIGAGATIRHCITIGARAIVGVGAAVVHDVPDDMTVVGVPARPLLK